jgi:hypothetical protein
MTATDYLSIVRDALEKLKTLNGQREALDIESVKLEQFIIATANLLLESERNLVLATMENLQEVHRLREVGLTDAIRSVLKAADGEWLTAAHVRDRLISAGFDFSSYTANPLASVSTTLRRIKSEDVETTNVDGGVTAYRWAGKRLVDLVKEAHENKKFRAMEYGLRKRLGEG